jgi:hypothetical protein
MWSIVRRLLVVWIEKASRARSVASKAGRRVKLETSFKEKSAMD